MIPLCRGGDDIVPNLFPTVHQFNIQKNGYYPIDYLKQAKNTNGQSIYSPYRLLKIINYMMKSSTVEARECVRDKNVKKFKKIILTPNAIDKYLKEIEEKERQKEIIEKIKDITNNFNIGSTLNAQKGNNNIERLKKGLNEEINKETGEKIFTEEEIQFLTEKQKGKKLSKQVVAEQKEKGKLGENGEVERVFEETIIKAKNRQNKENIKEEESK